MPHIFRLLLLTLCITQPVQAAAPSVLRKTLLPTSICSFLAGMGYSIYLDNNEDASRNQLILSKALIALGFIGIAADLWINPKSESAASEPYEPIKMHICPMTNGCWYCKKDEYEEEQEEEEYEDDEEDCAAAA